MVGGVDAGLEDALDKLARRRVGAHFAEATASGNRLEDVHVEWSLTRFGG